MDRPTQFRGVDVYSADCSQVEDVIVHAICDGTSVGITFVNPHSFNLAKTDAGLREDLAGIDYSLADGIGVVIAVRLLLGKRIQRLSFDLLAEALFERLSREGLSVFFLGGATGVADKAVHALLEAHPGLNVVGCRDGFFSSEEEFLDVERFLNDSHAQVVVVGMGAPAQERMVVRLTDSLDGVAVITCGGFFDQVGLPRPYYPPWAYPLRLNWVVRLARDPRRLWRRYLVGNPTFLIDSIRWRLKADRPSDGLK